MNVFNQEYFDFQLYGRRVCPSMDTMFLFNPFLINGNLCVIPFSVFVLILVLEQDIVYIRMSEAKENKKSIFYHIQT